MRWYTRTFIGLIVLFGSSSVLARGAHGGNDGPALAADDTTSILKRAVQSVKEGKQEVARRRLKPIFHDQPLYSFGGGSVAYWLGEAHRRSGRSDQAWRIWMEGVDHVRTDSSLFDHFLVDAYIQETFRRDENVRARRRAVDLYRAMIRRIGQEDLSPEEEEIQNRYLRELALVLPEGIQARTGLKVNRRNMDVSVRPSQGSGEVLLQWWRGQDPLPATRQNERLAEHLDRSVTARTQFANGSRVDDRGKVFIRLDEPRERVSVGMEDNTRISAIEAEIRRNEFWVYDQDRSAHFLFVELNPDEYQVAGVNDLFPGEMKAGASGSRGGDKEYLFKLENVLRELGTFHEAYVNLATEVFNRAALARDNAVGDVRRDPIDGSVANFLQSIRSRIATLDHKNTNRRIQNVPQSVTSVREESAPDLPIATRTARYLTDTGKTRVDVYWSVLTSKLVTGEKSDGRFTLLASVVQRNAERERQGQRRRRYEVKASNKKGGILTPSVLSVSTSDSLFHLDAQWDQYEAVGSDGSKQPGPLLRRHTDRYGAFTALRSDPDTLEVSDIKLFTVPAGGSEGQIDFEDAIPYPFDQVGPTQSLALGFEVYHLSLEGGGKSEYTVSYNVKETSGSDGVVTLLGDGNESDTKTSITYRGNSASTEEYILLDSKNLSGEEPRRIEVQVTVTDEKTSQLVTRSISFRMLPKKD